MKCFVSACGKTKKQNPEMAFVTVPYSNAIRHKWFLAVGKDAESANLKTTYYCCENCRNQIQV